MVKRAFQLKAFLVKVMQCTHFQLSKKFSFAQIKLTEELRCDFGNKLCHISQKKIDHGFHICFFEKLLLLFPS